MRRLMSKLMFALALSVLVAGAATATSPRSPVFGAAEVAVMSQADANEVTAKGYYANFYGYYAVDAAYTAYIYAYYARYYAATNSVTEQNWYYTASNAAYNAYIYSYYAYLYSFYGL